MESILPKPSPGRKIILTIKDVPSDTLISNNESGGGFLKIFLVLLVLYLVFRASLYDVRQEESVRKNIQPVAKKEMSAHKVRG